MSQFLCTKMMLWLSRSAPSLQETEGRSSITLLLCSSCIRRQASWGNSPDVKTEKLILEGMPVVRPRFWQRWLSSLSLWSSWPSTAVKAKLCYYALQHNGDYGHFQFKGTQLLSHFLCAWSCLVVGQGFKPWGAWRPSGSIPPCARSSLPQVVLPVEPSMKI